jgi:hypothetical protein
VTRAADSARRLSPDDYLALPLRAHELLRDVPVYDVTVVDLPGGGVGRRIADIRRLEAQSPPSVILVVYQFAEEALAETRNSTVHGWVCTALAPRGSGYRLYMAVYVRPVSWLTRPYLLLIEPFRRFLVYPAMLRRIRRAWIAAYGAAA